MSGLLAITRRFPGSEGFIPEGKGPPFLGGEPPLLRVRDKHVINAGLMHAVPGILVVHTAWYTGRATYLGYTEGIYTTYGIREAYTPPGIYLRVPIYRLGYTSGCPYTT